MLTLGHGGLSQETSAHVSSNALAARGSLTSSARHSSRTRQQKRPARRDSNVQPQTEQPVKCYGIVESSRLDSAGCCAPSLARSPFTLFGPKRGIWPRSAPSACAERPGEKSQRDLASRSIICFCVKPGLLRLRLRTRGELAAQAAREGRSARTQNSTLPCCARSCGRRRRLEGTVDRHRDEALYARTRRANKPIDKLCCRALGTFPRSCTRELEASSRRVRRRRSDEPASCPSTVTHCRG